MYRETGIIESFSGVALLIVTYALLQLEKRGFWKKLRAKTVSLE